MSTSWNFSTLINPHTALLSQGFPYNSLAAVTFQSTTDSLSFQGKSKKNRSSISSLPIESSLALHQDLDWMSWTIMRKASGKGKFNASFYPSLFQGLKLKTEAEYFFYGAARQTSLLGELSYINNGIKYKLGVRDTPFTLGASMLIGREHSGWGWKLGLNTETVKINRLNLFAWWVYDNANLVCSFEGFTRGEIGPNIKLYFLQKITEAASVGTIVESDVYRKTTSIRLAGKYDASEETSIKGKTTSEGNLEFSVIRKLNANVSLSGAIQVNILGHDWSKQLKYGVLLNLNY